MENKEILKKLKYIYFDLDGTLLNSRKEISYNNIKAIRKIESLGKMYSIATGRPYYFAQNEINKIKPKLPVISCNGAIIYDSIKNNIISYTSINKKSLKIIYDQLIKHNAVFIMYELNKVFLYKNNKTNPISKWFSFINDLNNSLENKIEISFINNPEEFNTDKYEIIKILIIFNEMNNNDFLNLKSNIENLDQIYLVQSQENVLDIMPSNVSKGDKLKELNDLSIINLNQTLVFGDADNDVTMFKQSKWSVIMNNSKSTKLKSIATFETGSNDEDGVAQFLNNIS